MHEAILALTANSVNSFLHVYTILWHLYIYLVLYPRVVSSQTPSTTTSTFLSLLTDASSRRADVITYNRSPASRTRRLLFDECLNEVLSSHCLSGHKYHEMAVAEVMTEAREISALQNGYVHAKPASISEPASISRTLPQLTPTYPIDNLEISPASSKSKQSTQLSANHASQSTNADQRDWSPPSTAFSSQEQLPVREGGHTVGPSSNALDHAIFQESVQSISARGSSGSPTKADASTDVVTERKRTASGQSKRASISSIHDLKVETSPGRSGTSTMLSNSSSGNIMEVCSSCTTLIFLFTTTSITLNLHRNAHYCDNILVFACHDHND